ncbi:hypothetical protein, partial [Flammeovirga sp. OC4]|uniref:hypothetical protein n=1 Tax=Flammeovirga sp. OC4 TaxID=1382345 RepID=UPI001C106CC6
MDATKELHELYMITPSSLKERKERFRKIDELEAKSKLYERKNKAQSKNWEKLIDKQLELENELNQL